MQTEAKWFDLWHFWHSTPYAGQFPRRCCRPQNLHFRINFRFSVFVISAALISFVFFLFSFVSASDMVDCFWRCLNCSVPFFPIIRRLDRHWRTYQDLIRQLSKDPHLSSLFADSIKKEFTFVFSSLPSIAKSMYRVISSFHLFQACGSSLGFPKSKLPGGLSWEIDRSAAALVLGVPSVSSGILFDESHFWHHVTSRKSINDQTRDFTSHTFRLRKVTWCNTILLLQTWNYTLCYDADKLQHTEK